MPRIAITAIAPDPKQPRKLFDVEKLEELAASIRENGQLQPITVRPADEPGKFWVSYGERRWRAHRLLVERGHDAFAQIDALVVDAPDVAGLRVRQIVENVARADMTPLEEAQAYADLLDHFSPEAAARKVGISAAKFNARLSLIQLEPSISKLLAGKHLDAADAQEIARLPDHKDQLKIVRMLNRGEIGKWKSLKAAVDALLAGPEVADLFGADAPAVTAVEVKTINAMEARIERLASALAGGWKDGECVIANRVSPDRAASMADKLAAIRVEVRHMEQALRNVTAQARTARAE